jgi:Flp pilus assembly protein TadD
VSSVATQVPETAFARHVIMCAMTDDLYERYKEALRTGHVAVLRGSLEEALTAYRLAADVAPSRALPHTSLGGVYMRLGHLEDALTEFAAAVARSPHDEGALLGQAEALTAAGMRSDAAAALDHVAEIQEAAGRLPEAADTLRRAVELEEGADRIRRQRALLREIRFSAGDHAAEQLLARALRLRDEPGAEQPRQGGVPANAAGMSAPAAQRPITSGYGFRETARMHFEDAIEEAEPAAAVQVPWPLSDRLELAPRPVALGGEAATTRPEPEPIEEPVEAEPEPEPEAEPVAAGAQVPEPEPIAVAAEQTPQERSPIGVMADLEAPTLTLVGAPAESDHQPTGDELLAAAEAADLAGDSTALRSLLLWTARAYAREGRFEAGLDATHRLLARTPSDVDAHLVLVELYVARSWDGLAAEKLRLLGRLADLNNDEETKQRLCTAATRAFPNNESLQSLCS